VVTNKVSRLAVEQSRVVHRGFVTRSLPGQLTECEVLGNRTTRFRIMVHASAPVAKFFLLLLISS
jgi:hypothetical protein